MSNFVSTNSVVRKIWGRADVVLFIFAGSAAEFALNKAVDWLYFTGKLPADPLGRLFSTVAYARRIIFADLDEAHRAIDQITAIHQGVEQSRGAKIPDWAYRDVLFMLIDYSIRSFELLDRKLTDAEKQEVFDVFYRVGARMQLQGLPQNYQEWVGMRQGHLDNDLICSDFTADLYRQYRKHLGGLRYFVMKQVQQMLLAPRVRQLLGMGRVVILKPVLLVYRLFRSLRWERPFKNALLPQKYKAQILALDAA
ncbi:uncharacterized protein DUF2236 [Mucilaginibacter yixingensis]|uniref:Uncharacterized protein DUF2236 n=1 Tax=Mucilaginibacter yixingensis TaxID=1295612 RepID=A0A2T5J6N1_9SPHI|nr:oxygenase MpaB family protein [Mucilaginibacter yixingensis]PTQ94106.1 uncharacterized protein DUF2236 [Mucilaginibacter yixingensis]